MIDPSGTIWPGDFRLGSASGLWRGAVAVSVAVHLMAAALAIAWPLWQGPRIDLSQAFMVSLVQEPGPPPAAKPGPKAGSPAAAPEAKSAPEPKPAPKKEPADVKVVEEPKPEKKALKPEAKVEKKPPAPAAAPQPSAQQAEAQISRAVENIRSRVQREARLDAAISQMRQKVGGNGSGAAEGEGGEAEAGSGVVASGFGPGQVPLSFQLYYQAVWDRIRSEWALPNLRQQDLCAVVSIRIARDGALEKIELESSSGDGLFDRSALNAVRASNPLPPLPGDYLGRWHEVGIRFRQ